MLTEVRAELERAHLARKAAENALLKARAETTRGRDLVERLMRQAEDCEAVEKQSAAALATKMRAAIVSGEAPNFDASEASKSAAARAEIEASRAATESVIKELRAAESEAEEALKIATTAVGEAIKNVMRSEVEKVAERWAAVDAEARWLRFRLC